MPFLVCPVAGSPSPARGAISHSPTQGLICAPVEFRPSLQAPFRYAQFLTQLLGRPLSAFQHPHRVLLEFFTKSFPVFALWFLHFLVSGLTVPCPSFPGHSIPIKAVSLDLVALSAKEASIETVLGMRTFIREPW